MLQTLAEYFQIDKWDMDHDMDQTFRIRTKFLTTRRHLDNQETLWYISPGREQGIKYYNNMHKSLYR